MAIAEKVEKKLSTSGAIDCDCHPHFRNGIHDLGPYLSEAMRERISVGTDSTGKGLPASEFKLPHPAQVRSHRGWLRLVARGDVEMDENWKGLHR